MQTKGEFWWPHLESSIQLCFLWVAVTFNLFLILDKGIICHLIYTVLDFDFLGEQLTI